MRSRATAADEVVFAQGESGERFYVLEEGEFLVSMQRDGEQYGMAGLEKKSSDLPRTFLEPS